MTDRYSKSKSLFDRAVKTIPLGSQTFSKSHIQYPSGASPLFLDRGRGARVWDVDGNEYVDLVMGLLPNVLGYCDEDVDAAILDQLKKGITFSLATTLEMELAERLVEIIPCAEMVRFGKNGSDATSGAVRIARAATGRDRIAVCGYHGWQDWYIGSTTRNKGVPGQVQNLTHKFAYNDIASLENILDSHTGQFAAVIMEPMNLVGPADGFLAAVKESAHRHGALFVFDEIITGFRFSLGGAQELFGVTPDLATFGKSMGNGMPISAVVGKKEYMKEMEEVFYSSTFGGEALSLAASIAVVDKMRRLPVIDKLWRDGDRLASDVQNIIDKKGLGEVIGLAGKPPWKILEFKGNSKTRAEALKTFFVKEMLDNGVLVNASHNVSYALTEGDLVLILEAYEAALEKLGKELDTGDMESRLGCGVIEPVFKVR